jgi:2,3-bisphosphoglycerate-independent phosphoglycerate mutase
MTLKSARPVMLAILDGWGIAPSSAGNAVALANTPNFDTWMANYPVTSLSASGLDVGLPEGQMGNSEVGHLNIGAGFVVYQDYTRISKSISDGDFFQNEVLISAIDHAKQTGGSLHLLGLLGPGGVHAYSEHLYALLELAKRHNFERVYIHSFLDGRDVLPASAAGYMEELLAAIERIGVGKVATVSGRYYAMDRDKRWERVGLAYRAIVAGQGLTASDPISAIQQSYAQNVTDEFVLPTVIVNPDGTPTATVKAGDAIIFYNFRPDRGRQLTRAFVQPDFDEMVRKHYQDQAAQGLKLPDEIFQRGPQIENLYYVTMTQYEAGLPVKIAYAPRPVTQPLAAVVSAAGLKQFHTAETEKYPHVTFFLNGGREMPFEGEDRNLVASPKVATYDLQPEMSAEGVADGLIEAINSDQYSLFVVNFANPDMVGHTGSIPAVIKACETVDSCIGRVMNALLAKGGCALVIADHGNAEQMIDPETGGPHTAHTTNLVPCILIAPPDAHLSKDDVTLRAGGRLADVAPTLLDLLDLQPASDMTGQSLIERK